MKTFLSFLTLLLTSLWAALPVSALVGDVNANSVATVSNTSTTDLDPNGWYVMFNMGRKVYVYGNGQVTSTAPASGASFRELAPYLVRFVSVGDEGKYLIQSAEGNYYKDLKFNSNAGTDPDSASAGSFTVEEIYYHGRYWYVKGSQYIMDSNGSEIVGWATSKPVSVTGNDSWRIFPVTLETPDHLTGGAKVSYQLAQGGLYRFYNHGQSDRVISENSAQGASATLSAGDMSQMWIVEHNSDGYSLRNALSGNYLQNDYTCKPTIAYWTISLSPNNTSDADPYIIIAHGNVTRGSVNCANLNNQSLTLTDWYYINDHNSEWTIDAVPSSEVDTATVRANLDNKLGAGNLDLLSGAYYRFQSLTTGNVLTENLADNYLITASADSALWNQYWKVAYDSAAQSYTIQSIYSGKYITHKAANNNSPCNGSYVTSNSNAVNRPWLIQPSSYPWQTTYTIIEPNKRATGLGVKSNNSANVDIASNTAQWILKREDLSQAQVQAASEAYDEYRLLRNTSATLLNSRLQIFFDDWACTKLKDEYQALSDDSLSALMHNSEVPRMLINVALKVKNDTWGHREKEFRIYDYKAYSDHTKWNANNLTGTNYQFSPQTGPTGISVKQGDVVVLMVGASPALNSTLTFSSNEDYTVNASETTLRRGVNVWVADEPGFLFVHHTITNVNRKLADFPAITVHIEGGRVQGYFDITRGHTNADWKDFQANLFQDRIVHLKSKYYEYNMLYQGVLNQIRQGELDEVDTDGTPKGIEGTLMRWDSLVGVQRYLMGVDQFRDRFNCMLSASSSNSTNPSAGYYGTYYPSGVGTIMNYSALTHGSENDEGGNFWCIAHETGHIHQGLIKMCGTTEISNNFLAQVNTWIQGSNTGRGGPWSVAQASFHKNSFWGEYDLWQRSRMYFQLWLYFHLQGHNTEFYPRLFDKLRAAPMTFSRDSLNPSSGTTDYLRFAKFCCDVAQADLSEFFQFWGFFVPIRNHHTGDYGDFYQTTTLDEINEAKAYMHQYPKKLGNILFIDERIEKYAANYPGMAEGTMRLGTSASATPGDASEVGETGMFTLFADDVNYRQYSCGFSSQNDTCIISSGSGSGAVGFKVYNANNEMACVSNTYRFAIPASLRSQQYQIRAALGDGTDRLIYISGSDSTIGFRIYDSQNNIIARDNEKQYSVPADIANGQYYVMAVKSGGTEQLVYETTEGLSPVTGVNNVTNGSADLRNSLNPTAPVYNLYGQRAKELIKGHIYIQRGKKVVY